jgi:hypothetical protein
VRGVLGSGCPLAPLLVLRQVLLHEGWLDPGDDLVRQPSDEGGQGYAYIPFSLMSSNNGGHKGWFDLKTDPEHALSEYIGSAITTT